MLNQILFGFRNLPAIRAGERFHCDEIAKLVHCRFVHFRLLVSQFPLTIILVPRTLVQLQEARRRIRQGMRREHEIEFTRVTQQGATMTITCVCWLRWFVSNADIGISPPSESRRVMPPNLSAAALGVSADATIAYRKSIGSHNQSEADKSALSVSAADGRQLPRLASLADITSLDDRQFMIRRHSCFYLFIDSNTSFMGARRSFYRVCKLGSLVGISHPTGSRSGVPVGVWGRRTQTCCKNSAYGA